MLTVTAHQIARVLKYELGVESGIRYAERIVAYTADTQYKREYAEAAAILRQSITTKD